VQVNKICNLEDWALDDRRDTIRRVLPYFLEQSAAFPDGMEHRKHWEFAQLLDGIEYLGAVTPDSMVLAVAAGQEEVVYDLTNRVRWVFATDIYGSGDFVGWSADATILRDPDSAARCPWNRRRLVTQYMDALDLRYEDETFDVVYSLSSIEHFGGPEGAVASLEEQRRVTKMGGVVMFTTEVLVDGSEPLVDANLTLFSPEQLTALCEDMRGLDLVEPIDFSLSERTRAKVKPLQEAEDEAARGFTDYPHVIVDHRGHQYTSVSVFLRRTA
jgi:hypothetical protein